MTTTLDDFDRMASALDAQDDGANPDAVARILHGNPEEDHEQAVRNAAYRTLDDMGNAERVRDLFGDRVRFLGDEDRWVVWDEKRWAIDLNSRYLEVAKGVADSMRDEQVDIVRGKDEEPPYPDDYPVKVKGKDDESDDAADADGEEVRNLPPDVWMRRKPLDAIGWLYASPDRAYWLQEWLKWASKQDAAQALAAFARKCRDMGRLRSMMQAAAPLDGIAALRPDFDRRGTRIFNVVNGSVDTRTGKFREHRQTDYNTRLCNVEYQEGAPAPLWISFLKTNIPDDEVRRYLQKLAGYAMTGDADLKLLALLHSDVGNTGKSLFINVLLDVFGIDYAAGLAQGALAPRRDGGDGGRDPDRHAMMGKRLLVASEFRRNEPMDEAFVKRYTGGGDPIQTRGNHSKGNIEWYPEGLILIGTNRLFRIDLDDPAVWDRLRVITFTVAFPVGHKDRDPELKDKIVRGERAGVLAWMVEGLRLYRAEGLETPTAVERSTTAYKSASDHVGQWLTAAQESGALAVDRTSTTSGSTPSELWREFERWASDEKLSSDLKMSTFKARLVELGFRYVKNTTHPRKDQRVMRGIEVVDKANPWP